MTKIDWELRGIENLDVAEWFKLMSINMPGYRPLVINMLEDMFAI